MITNHPIWRNGKPVLWPDAERLTVETATLYAPEREWTYSHHPHLVRWEPAIRVDAAGSRLPLGSHLQETQDPAHRSESTGRFFAIWSNGHRDEDAPGQRVLISSSPDFTRWSEPHVLASPGSDPEGRENVLTAAGFHQHAGTLVAYFAEYGPEKQNTRLLAVATTDGENWTVPCEVGLPICPNHGPQPTATGRLVISGNVAFPHTDDPVGLGGWRMAGIFGGDLDKDDPAAFWDVARRRRWPVALCEGSFFQTGDRTLRMLLRSTGPGFRYRLWLSESHDDGEAWSDPVETEFSDTDAKFHFGRLPDGRYYYVGCPVGEGRTPLVLSLSADGESFGRHFILGDSPYAMRREGTWKGGEYGYPHTLVHDGSLYVIVSRQKEGVEVLRTPVRF